MTDEKSFIPQ